MKARTNDEDDEIDELALNSPFGMSLSPPVAVAGRKRRANTTTSTGSATKRLKPVPFRAKAARKTRDDIYNDLNRILGPNRSPLYKSGLNLLEVLYHPKAQASLRTSSQGYKIASLSPEELSRAVAAFKEDGLSGKHDPLWLADAQTAYSERHAGRFDDLLDHKFKEQWGEPNEEITDSENDEVSMESSSNDQDQPAYSSANGFHEQIKEDI